MLADSECLFLLANQPLKCRLRFLDIGLFLNFAFCIVHGEAYRQRDHFGFWVTNQSVFNLSAEPCKPEKLSMGLGMTNPHENVSNIDDYL